MSTLSLATGLLLLFVTGLPLRATVKDDGDEQYRFLAGLVEKQMYELAVDEGKKFLREHPDHAKSALARYRLAGALYELGRTEEAAKEYEVLAKDGAFEYRAEALFRSGECALARGDVARARTAFEAVLAAGQDYLHAPALFFLGESAFAARDLDEAARRYEELLREHPDSENAARARRSLVWCAWGKGDVDTTVRLARAFLQRSGDPALADEVRVLLGEALLAAKDPRGALDAFRSVEGRELADARARGEGFALADLDDLAGSARAFEALLESTPESRFASEARLQAGIQRLRSGDADAAVRHLRANGDAPETLHWLAQAELAAGDPEAALATLDRGLSRRPPRELEQKLFVLRGDCLGKLGRTAESRAAYEKSGSDYALYAAALDALNKSDAREAARLAGQVLEHPESTYANAARMVLAEAFFAEERFDEARRLFAEVAGNPADPKEETQALARAAWCLYLSGDLAGSAQAFGALAAEHPSAEEAEEALAMVARAELEAGDVQGASAASARYLERHPQGRFADQALYSGARAADPKSARERYERLLAQHPDSPLAPNALIELAELLSAAGEKELAATRYATLLERHPDSEPAPRARYGLAWCRFEAGDFAGAGELAQQLAADDGSPGELREAALELQVFTAARGGSSDAACEAWRRFAAVSRDEKARFEAARAVLAACRESEKPREGQALLDACLKTLKDPVLVVRALVEGVYLALDQDDVDRAEAALRVARTRAVEDALVAEASFHVGEARLARGESDAAIGLYRNALVDSNPRRTDVLYKLGFVELQRGELEPAAEAFRTLVETAPESPLVPEALFLAGEAAYRQERHADALELLGRARSAARDPELGAKILFRLGLANGALERWSECEAALAELAQRHPEFPNLAESELWRGRSLLALGKPRAARAALERTVALDKGSLAAQARVGLGRVCEAENRSDDALSEYLKVALLYADEDAVSEALFRAGAALEALGDPEKALAQYRELAQKHPRSSYASQASARIRALEP